NAPLVPALFVARARALLDGVEVGLVTDLPVSGGGFSIPLAGVEIEPGACDRLEIRFNVQATAPNGLFSMMMAPGGIVSADANLGAAVVATASAGASFPFSSGITQLEAPARELAVGFAERMPAALVADGRA